MKIAMDIDGVTADLVAGFERQYREAFAKPDFSHGGTWDLHAGTVFTDAGKLFAYFDKVPNFWRDLPLVPGAAGGCYQLVENGHTVTFVTNRATEQQRLQTRDWLEAWWPERKNTPTVEYVPGYKGVLDFQVYVDDNPSRIQELVDGWKSGENEYGRKPFVVVFDQPWNRDLPDAPNLWRAKGWDELVEMLLTVGAKGLEALTSEPEPEPEELENQPEEKPAKKAPAKKTTKKAEDD